MKTYKRTNDDPLVRVSVHGAAFPWHRPELYKIIFLLIDTFHRLSHGEDTLTLLRSTVVIQQAGVIGPVCGACTVLG